MAGFTAFMLYWFLVVMLVLSLLPRRWTQIAFGKAADDAKKPLGAINANGVDGIQGLHLHKQKRASFHIGQKPRTSGINPEVRETAEDEHFVCQGEFPHFEDLLQQWDRHMLGELHLCKDCYREHIEEPGRVW